MGGVEQVLTVLGAAVAIIVALWWGRLYAARRITRWCDEQGYELVDWRGAKFFEGPNAWFRTDNQDAYYIEVRDRQGLSRAGYLAFGNNWRPWPFGRREVRVKWD